MAKQFNTVFGTPDMYRRLTEGVCAGIYVADAKGDLIYVNQAFVHILGYQSKDEVIGLNLAEKLYVHPEERMDFLSKMEKLGFVNDYEVQNKRKDGSVVILSVTGNIIYGERSEMVGVEGVIHDITVHKKLEQDLIILRNAVDQTADHVMITNKEGVIQYVNPAFEKTTGYRKEEALGKNPKILQSGRQSREYYLKLWDTILSGKIFFARTINKKKNGEFYIADQTISPITDGSGAITHFVSIWKDITETVKLEERLKVEKQKLEEIIGFDEKISAIRNTDKLMDFVVSKTTKILDAGKCSIMLIDKETGTLCVKGNVGYKDGGKHIMVMSKDPVTARIIEDGQPVLVKDIGSDPRSNHLRELFYAGRSFMIAPVKRDGEVVGFINVTDKHAGIDEDDTFHELDLKILSDIAREVSVSLENVKFFKELQYLTVTDPLTGIHNFRHYANTMEYEIKRLRRIPGQLGLIMLDVDNFKSYNDQFGHLAGDQLLKDIGHIILRNLRELDVLCRYAGDEFVVILPGTDKAGSRILAERIREEIGKTKFQKPVTVSLGVAQYRNAMGRYDLTSKADRALYQAKQEGKNRVCVFD